MLGLKFQLTPAQVDVLLLFVFGKEVVRKDVHGNEKKMLPLELAMLPNFLPSSGALRRKGMVAHSEEDGWVPTDEGIAVANLIYKKARQIVDLVESDVEAVVDEREANDIRG